MVLDVLTELKKLAKTEPLPGLEPGSQPPEDRMLTIALKGHFQQSLVER